MGAVSAPNGTSLAERCAGVRPTFLNALGTIFASSPTLGVWRKYFLQVSCRGDQMGEVVQFIRKPDPDRAARLIQEARAIYESIFPTEIASTAPIRDDDTSS